MSDWKQVSIGGFFLSLLKMRKYFSSYHGRNDLSYLNDGFTSAFKLFPMITIEGRVRATALPARERKRGEGKKGGGCS